MPKGMKRIHSFAIHVGKATPRMKGKKVQAMLMDHQDFQLLVKLHSELLEFVNQRLKVIPPDRGTPGKLGSMTLEDRGAVRDALVANLDLIDVFTAENPADLSKEELDIVRSWRQMVSGKFLVYRHLKKYSVFLADCQDLAYGVLSLAMPIEEMIGPNLPILVQAVLLPFKGKIIYDGLMTTYRLSFGPGIRRSLNDRYNKAKELHGIIESLPMSDRLPPPVTKTKSTPNPARVAKHVDDIADEIVDLVSQFCFAYLNEEYAVLCRKLTGKLARKRPSLLLRGAPNTWACGIVRMIGEVNFLDDKSQSTHMKMTDIDRHFGVAKTTGAAKQAEIRKMFRIHPFDLEWTLPSGVDNNPLLWMVSLNGLVVDLREAPREMQQAAFENGLIPYIPADRKPIERQSNLKRRPWKLKRRLSNRRRDRYSTSIEFVEKAFGGSSREPRNDVASRRAGTFVRASISSHSPPSRSSRTQ